MAASYVAGSQFGNGQTAITASPAVVIPSGASVGDYAVVEVICSNQTQTVTTPTGWTLLSGPDAIGTSTYARLYGKTLVSGDPGSTVTFTFSGAVCVVATCAVATGVTATGILVSTPVVNTVGSTSSTLPTQASTPAGAFVLAFASGQSATTTTQTYTAATGYTNGTGAGTAYTTAPEVASQPMYKVAGAAGSYGGETVTASSTATALNYLVVLPATTPVSVADTGSGADSITVVVPVNLADTGSGADSITATVTLGIADTGSGADSITVVVPVNLTDTGTSYDSVTFVAATPGGHLPGVATLTVTVGLAALAGNGTSTAALAGNGTSTAALAAQALAVATIATT